MLIMSKFPLRLFKFVLNLFAMMKCYTLILIFISFLTANAQELKVYDNYDELQSELFADNETLYVINFWATWCAPCIKELPHFETLYHNTQSQKVKIILVSLDFKNQVDTKLKAFIKKKNYSAQIVALTDKDYNNWLGKVDQSWSGSIPATLLIKGDKRLFKEEEFTSAKELQDFINTINNI
jgi:thiol-disulfide isomerase/thioredoxin